MKSDITLTDCILHYLTALFGPKAGYDMGYLNNGKRLDLPFETLSSQTAIDVFNSGYPY